LGTLQGHAFFHPALEQGKALFGPGLVTWHAPVFEARVDLFGLRLDLIVRREVKPVFLHRVHIGTVAKQRPDVDLEAYSHRENSSLERSKWALEQTPSLGKFVFALNIVGDRTIGGRARAALS
jgi:hypothetical protein